MTQSDLCPICGRALADHPDGLACCPKCGGMRFIVFRGIVHCESCTYHESIATWNTRAHPSPWLNAPIPEYGCVQQLVIMEDGSWGIQYIEEYDKGVTKFCFTGVNGGPARTERRTMINGKLVYEEEK